jgi:F420H(2)-dependent quinone reductase
MCSHSARRIVDRMPVEGEYVPSPAQWVRDQVEEYERSGGTSGTKLLDTDMPVVIFTMRGAHSGLVRKVPLMRVEHDGEYALIASYGGSPQNPKWYANVRADPRVTVQDGPAIFDAVVRQVEGDERAAWWARAIDAYPPYGQYQERTERTIPVLVASRTA